MEMGSFKLQDLVNNKTELHAEHSVIKTSFCLIIWKWAVRTKEKLCICLHKESGFSIISMKEFTSGSNKIKEIVRESEGNRQKECFNSPISFLCCYC